MNTDIQLMKMTEDLKRLILMEEGRLVDMTHALKAEIQKMADAQHFEELMERIRNFHVVIEK